MSSVSQVTTETPTQQDEPLENAASPGSSNQVHGNTQIVLAAGTVLKSTPGFVGTA